MATLYIRNVPDSVADQLARLARRERMSVTAFVAREIEVIARRAENEALFASLPDLDLPLEHVLASIDEGREQ